MKQNVSVGWNVTHIAEDTETERTKTVYRNTRRVMGISSRIWIWGLCSHRIS